MSKIDSSRLSSIFQSLVNKSEPTPKAQSIHKKYSPSLETVEQVKKSQTELKKRIRDRIAKIPSSSITTVVVQEIVIWEFGEEILDHPNFKEIATTIATSIENSPKLKDHMKEIIKMLT
ncbi:hypothetical protein [Teredinibacter sp. KSP-S5-2]|uniref:hypothetical protein n=1 Tax=Teredinibacter sp. KSP-S5-2 TaxID=3034506 RepID=UPI002934C045|nr:hypothetical protein [Teredinibacter sp. KSP-S5-2]WNO11353.1 hypothetical protein P5V12_09230 [Teredinibacter sp. KSP-S5-2]